MSSIKNYNWYIIENIESSPPWCTFQYSCTIHNLSIPWLRRSRTPVSARTPPPSAVFMSPSPSWSSTLPSSINTARSVNVRGSDGVDSANGSTCGSPIYRCSEDGTLRIPIRSASAKPKTTSGYYTTNNKHFLWFSTKYYRILRQKHYKTKIIMTKYRD